MTPRFHCPDAGLAAGREIVLPEAAAHHAMRVLRLTLGAPVCLFDGSGGEYAGRISATGRELRVQLGEHRARECESPLALTLVQALAAGDKMDWVVQKAVELGAQALQPLAAERSVLKLTGERAERRVAHWREIAVSAAEQCGRNRLMRIEPPLGLAQWLAASAGQPRWLLDPEAGLPLSAQTRPQHPLYLMVGPEGGWSEAERRSALAAGCIPLRLGPRVLRTETAGPALLAAMAALWGDF